jgi:hypothetical protein
MAHHGWRDDPVAVKDDRAGYETHHCLVPAHAPARMPASMVAHRAWGDRRGVEFLANS